MPTFDVLHTKILHHGHAFDLERLLVSLPDGSQKPYELVRHRPSVTIVPVDVSGSMIFVSQYRIGAGKNLLELPAGNLEPGEDPSQGASRELREEIGMAPGQLIAIGQTFLCPGYSTEWMSFYLATGLFPAPLPADADEFIQVITIPITEAYQRAEEGQIQDGKSLAALLLARPSIERIFGRIENNYLLSSFSSRFLPGQPPQI